MKTALAAFKKILNKFVNYINCNILDVFSNMKAYSKTITAVYLNRFIDENLSRIREASASIVSLKQLTMTTNAIGWKIILVSMNGLLPMRSDSAPLTKEECYSMDSCNGGEGLSGGGCYKWARSALSEREPWDILSQE